MDNFNPVDILLVEDNPADVELTLRAFKKNRIANPVHVARDGAAALDFLLGQGAFAGIDAAASLKLVLLDLKLPLVSGLEVLERIKGDARLRKIPVVVLTSSREEPDIQRSYELGVNSYIVKPVDFEKFVEAVDQLGLYWLLLNLAPK
jgi:two-component system response regulator